VTDRVRLGDRALATIVHEAPASSDGRETGGILLGFDAGPLTEALVMEAGDPGPQAERRQDFFRRDVEHAQRLADEAFTRTTSRWIGEWHTHPHGDLAPSRKDLRTYRGFLRDPELAFDSFVAVIVGPGDDGWTKPRAAAWLIERRSILPALLLPHVERLKIVLEEDAPEDLLEENVSDE
jgi:integrative and conjugative element protein (TIGR02256 family)